MKQRVSLVVILPVGPLGSRNHLHHIIDTVSSVTHYAVPNRQIIIQDNSHPLHLGDKLQQTFPELVVIRTPENYGLYGGLYKAESLALLYAYSAYDFQVLIRMDADALMIGPGLEEDAIRFFAMNPNTGLLGNHLATGEGIAWARKELMKQIGAQGWIRDRKRAARLHQLVSLAQDHGYQLGEHVLGGAVIFNPVLLQKLVDNGLLLNEDLRRAKLQDDHLFGLLCKAVGMKLGEFNAEGYPMAVAWKNLPDSPQALVQSGKKLVHSTRLWNTMDEDQIRDFFRQRRTAS